MDADIQKQVRLYRLRQEAIAPINAPQLTDTPLPGDLYDPLALSWPKDIYKSQRDAFPNLQTARVFLRIQLRHPQIIAQRAAGRPEDPLIRITLDPPTRRRARVFTIETEIEGWTTPVSQRLDFTARDAVQIADYTPVFLDEKLPLLREVKAPLHVSVWENDAAPATGRILIHEVRAEIWLLPSDALPYARWEPAQHKYFPCNDQLHAYFNQFGGEFRQLAEDIQAQNGFAFLGAGLAPQVALPGLYQLLKTNGLKFTPCKILNNPETGLCMQRVRRPSEIWESKHFNCLEGVLLMLGLCYQLNLPFPVGAAIRVNGASHALFAWQEIEVSSDWRFLELTCIQIRNFQEAIDIAAGSHGYEVAANPFHPPNDSRSP